MLAIARALMLDPVLLLLDEPSAGLSPVMMNIVFDRIRQINQTGVALLLVEQNARDALQMSDRGYILVSGEKPAGRHWQGPVKQPRGRQPLSGRVSQCPVASARRPAVLSATGN